jgi:hypothetical protein
MRYQIKVAGKMYAGNDPRVLLKRAVEAWKTLPKQELKDKVNQEVDENLFEELALSH